MKFHVIVAFVAFVLVQIAAATGEGDVTTAAAPAADAVTAGSESAEDSSSKKFKEYVDFTPKQRSGVVTVEFKDVSSDKDVKELHNKFPTVIVTILNQDKDQAIPPPTDRRRRRRQSGTTGRYAEDGVLLIDVEPEVLDGRLRVSAAVQDKDGNILPANELEEILKNKTDVIDKLMPKPVETVYIGLPEDFEGALLAADRRRTVWEEHWKMFLVVLIVIAVAILIVILCLLCMCCCQRKQTPSPTKVELTSKKPPPPSPVREDMMEVTPIVPLQYAPVSSQSPKTPSEATPMVEEENGWIVPIDQLSPEELEQPDIQISKL